MLARRRNDCGMSYKLHVEARDPLSSRAAAARRAPIEAPASRRSLQRIAPSVATVTSPGAAHQPSSTI